MSAPVGLAMEELHTDQAPPLAIPASFFVLAPLAMLASGAVLVVDGDAALVSRWLPPAMAATHLGTLGFLAAVMLGALYQIIPVVAGAPVPRVRLAHAVHALFAAGVGVLAIGLLTGHAPLLVIAPALLLAALLLFLGPVELALAGRPTRGEATVWGMRLAVLGLLAVGARGRHGARARGPREGRRRLDDLGQRACRARRRGVARRAHRGRVVAGRAHVAYLTEPLPRWSRLATLGALALALVVVPIVPLAGGGPGASRSPPGRRSSWCGGSTPSWPCAPSIGGDANAPTAASASGGRRSRSRRSSGARRGRGARRQSALGRGARLVRRVGLGRHDRARDADAYRAVPRVVPPLRRARG